jgi:hypothetical protein
MGVSGYLHPGLRGINLRYPLNRRLGGSQSLSGSFQGKTVSCLCWESNHELSDVQFLAYSHYTDYAIPTPYTNGRFSLYNIHMLCVCVYYVISRLVWCSHGGVDRGKVHVYLLYKP